MTTPPISDCRGCDCDTCPDHHANCEHHRHHEILADVEELPCEGVQTDLGRRGDILVAFDDWFIDIVVEGTRVCVSEKGTQLIAHDGPEGMFKGIGWFIQEAGRQ